MATRTTSRAGLIVDDGQELLPDSIVRLGQSLDRIDALLGAEQVTSSTRPAAPFPGEIIFETDTKRYLAYQADLVDWYKIAGPPSLQRDENLVSAAAVAPSASVYTAVWTGAAGPIPHGGILRLNFMLLFTSTANCAGFWRPVYRTSGGAYSPIPNFGRRRFLNNGVANSIMPTSGNIEMPVTKSTVFDIGIEVTVDSGSAAGATLTNGSLSVYL